jgi:type IV fimbrial biogenesis protein FimT
MPRCHCKGITLAEFVVALLVVGVSALYAAPMYYKIMHNIQATSYTNDLVSTLTYARAQAATRGLPVSVCSSDNGLRCSDTPWEFGYIVFIDSDGAAGAVDGNDRVLRQFLRRDAKATITLHGGRYVRFGVMGDLIAQSVKKNSPSLDARQLLAHWFGGLSLMTSAQAEVQVTRSAMDVSIESFTICVRHTGRTVRLSPQGRISTADAYCS